MSRSKLWMLMRRDFVGAGDRYYQDGNLERASELYARARKFSQAARICLENGDLEGAVAYHLAGGSPRDAGDALAASGEHRRAIDQFEAAGAWWQAAESALKIQRPALAGAFFEKAGAFRRAAGCFEEAGEAGSAIRAWESESQRLRQMQAMEATMDPQELRQVDLRRAALLERAGRFSEAASVLSDEMEFERAARLFERAREFDSAVRCFARANAMVDAARLLPEAGDVAPGLEGEILSRAGQPARAARLFEDAGRLEEAAEQYEKAAEFERAALLQERLGELERAAALFLTAGLPQEAGRCFERIEDYTSAARAWLQAGADREAARCHERLGRFLPAALRYMEAGDPEAASRALQCVEVDDADFEAATFRLVPLLLEDGLGRGALHRLSMLEEAPGVSASTAERFYWEGRSWESLGRDSRAILAYQKAAAIDRSLADLGERLRRLEEREALSTQSFDTGEPVAEKPSGTWLVGPGDTVGDRYEIVRELGRGGMSRVYEAFDADFEDPVALKLLVPRSDDDRAAEERLLQEVKICRRISHPNVVRVFDFGRYGASVYITMELLQGETLDATVREEGPLSFAGVRAVLGDILSGLSEAHRRKVIHRDLKPLNVFLTQDGAKIMDFGIAHSLDHDMGLTRTGHVIGSPMFMSPEQLQGKTLDARSDLYSLGVLAFFALTGREPFTGTTPTALALKHLGEAPPRLSTFRSDTPMAWESFLARLLAKRPEGRFGSAEEVTEALAELPVDSLSHARH